MACGCKKQRKIVSRAIRSGDVVGTARGLAVGAGMMARNTVKIASTKKPFVRR